MKIAYIEFNLVHDEIQPVFHYLASQLGHSIDFYIPKINSNRNVFCKCDNVNTFVLDYQNPHAPIRSPELEIEKQWGNYDLLIMGTGEPSDRIRKFSSIPVKNKAMIIHNYHSQYSKLPIKTILLADFIKKNLQATTSYVIKPFYCGNITMEMKPNQKIFCVQGNFQSKKRNYNSLAEAVLGLKLSGLTPNDFQVEIIGRYNSKDITWHNFGTEGHSFDVTIQKLGIDAFFRKPDKEYMYPEYLEKMYNSRYILPLIDDTHPHKFFKNSCTSSINLGIACLCIPVLNEKLAQIYDIDFGYHYKNKDLFSAMKQAISSDNDEHILKQVFEYRNTHLEQSVAEFKKLL